MYAEYKSNCNSTENNVRNIKWHCVLDDDLILIQSLVIPFIQSCYFRAQ